MFAEKKKSAFDLFNFFILYHFFNNLHKFYRSGAMLILGTYHLFVEEYFPEVFKDFEEALKISEEIKDYGVSSFYARYWFGVASAWICEFERSAKYLQLALDINLATKILWGIATTKSSLAYLCYYLSGKINLQFQTASDALRIAEESGDIYSKSISYVIHGVSPYGKGLLEEAEGNLLKKLEICERINFLAWITVAKFHLGENYFEMKEISRSKEFYKKGVVVLEGNRLFPSWADVGKIGLTTRSRVMNREKDFDLESLYTCSRNNKANIYEGWIQRYIGEILFNIDDQHFSETEHWIQKAIEADQRNRMMFQLGRDYALYAELFKRKGDRPKARENFCRAIEILKECGADGWVVKYERELSLL